MKSRNRAILAVGLILFGAYGLKAAEETNNWPKKIEKNGATIIIYQPQIESLTANSLESRAAISITNEE